MPPLTPANEAVRAVNVTASEVAALMPSRHPYTTPGQIWDRLKGLSGPSEPSEAMRLGSHMERPILRFAMERDNFTARANSRTFQHKRVRLCATPDAFVRNWYGSRAMIEVKMSARHDQWRELPTHVEWQCRAQMACTNVSEVIVYALVGMRLITFAVYRDPVLERELEERVTAFWTDHIVTGIRPGDVIAPEPAIEFGV